MIVVSCFAVLCGLVGGNSVDTNEHSTVHPLPHSKLQIIPKTSAAIVGQPIKLTCKSHVLHRQLKWHLPTNIVYNSVILSPKAHDSFTTSKILLTIYNKTKEPLQIRCSSRDRNTILDLHLANLELPVHYKPVIVAFEQHWRFGVGGKASLQCIIDASPQAKVEWHHKGLSMDLENKQKTNQLLPTDKAESRIKVINTERSDLPIAPYSLLVSQLIIDGIVYPDYGEYTCDAKNEIGYSENPGYFKIDPKYHRIGDDCVDNNDCTVENSICQPSAKTCDCKEGYILQSTQDKGKQLHKCIEGGGLLVENIDFTLAF